MHPINNPRIMEFLKLIRYKNLIIIALTQVLIRYSLMMPYNLPHALSDLQFALLVFATLLIAAGGYAINDYFDIQVDRINKAPDVVVGNKIKRRTAMFLHIALSAAGLLIGAYLSFAVGMPKLVGIFVLSVGLLWFYSTHFKKQFLTGNLVISFLTAVSVMLVGWFELVPALEADSIDGARGVLIVMGGYAVFAWISTWLREIVKDLEDIKGDQAMGYHTMVIEFGEEKARYTAIVGGMILFAGIGYASSVVLKGQPWHLLYTGLFIGLPLVAFLWELRKKQPNYTYLTRLLKGIMLTGALSMVVFQWISRYGI